MECGRIYDYSISISSDNNNWITIIPQATSASNAEWTIEEFTPVGARYVQIHLLTNNQSTWQGYGKQSFMGIIAAEDVTPPQVVSAELMSSTNLLINFSEALKSSIAQNKSNYLINNGITVSSAVLSGTQVSRYLGSL